MSRRAIFPSLAPHNATRIRPSLPHEADSTCTPAASRMDCVCKSVSPPPSHCRDPSERYTTEVGCSSMPPQATRKATVADANRHRIVRFNIMSREKPPQYAGNCSTYWTYKTPVSSLHSTRLLDQVRERLRYMNYSLSTEQVCIYWVRFFHTLVCSQWANAAPARHRFARGRSLFVHVGDRPPLAQQQSYDSDPSPNNHPIGCSRSGALG